MGHRCDPQHPRLVGAEFSWYSPPADDPRSICYINRKKKRFFKRIINMQRQRAAIMNW